MVVKKSIRILLFITLSILVIALPAKVTKASNDMVWDSNQVLGQNGAYDFAGIYEFDNLTIGDDVEITSSGISQLVIKVNGTLRIGRNTTIRVRNGFYPNAPTNPISAVTENNLTSLGTDAGGFRVYPDMFGKGGNGGDGGSNLANSGGGGGGGFGGGVGGSYPYSGYGGEDGSDNGGRGGQGGGTTTYNKNGGTGGGGTSLGAPGALGVFRQGGGGGGGNGGSGGYGGEYGAGGGGGGGYGGGILTIAANNLVYDTSAPPHLIVSGQKAGVGGNYGLNVSGSTAKGSPGENGQSGLVILNVPNSSLTAQLWNLGSTTLDELNSSNGGHGTVVGDPQKVFINDLGYVPTTGITIPTTLKVPLQGTRSLTATVSPSSSTLKYVAWSSSNTSYASVDANGVVTGNQLGTTTITAKTADGIVAACTVTIVPKSTSITLNKHELWLNVNSSTTILTTTVTPTNALAWAAWKSSDEAVVTVDAAGNVKPVGSGTALITATSGDGAATDTCTVHVYPATHILVTGIGLSDLTVPVGTTSPLQAVFYPSDATNKNVSWSSDDLSIATVDTNGVVSGLKLGTTKIRVKTAEGEFTAGSTVTVAPRVTAVTLDKKELWLTVNSGNMSLKASITPTNALNKVSWSSSDSAIATVDAAGVVKPLTSGTTLITVTSEDLHITDTCTVHVYPEDHILVTGVYVSNIKLALGTNTTVQATFQPSNATNKALTFQPADPGIISVDNSGVITGQKLGTTTLNMKTVEGGFTASCTVTVVPQTTSVTLDKKELWLTVNSGNTGLKATMSPADALNTFAWTSSEPTAATVDSSGVVKPLSSGTTIITATSGDGKSSDTCTVHVYPADHILVTGVSIQDLTLPVGTSTTMQAAFQPANATNQQVTWSSDNEKIATIDSEGVVTGLMGGTAALTVKTVEGGFIDTCTVTVVPRVNGITLDKKELWLTVMGSTATLAAAITPTGAKNNVTWTSDNPAVASIDAAGLVTPVASGKAKITAQAEDGGYTAYCDVYVWPTLINRATINPALNTTTAPIDSKIKITFTKDMSTGNSNINGSTFYLEHEGNLVPAVIAFPDLNTGTGVFRTAQLTPVQPLMNNTVYTAYLTHQVKSKDGTCLGDSAQSDIHWNFTTVKAVTNTLTDIPWPMYMHDARHTGQSEATMAMNNVLKWKQSFSAGPLASPAVLKEGIALGDGGVRVLNLDGSVKWSCLDGATDLTPVVTQGYFYNLINSRLITLDTQGTAKSSLGFIEGFQRFFPLMMDERGNILTVTSTFNPQSDQSPYLTQLHAYNTQTSSSSALWNQNSTTNFWGLLGCPPAIDSSGTAYVALNSRLMAIAGSGNTIWTAGSVDGSSISSISISSDNKIYLTTLGGSVQVLDINGRTLWKQYYGDTLTAVALSKDGEAVFGSRDGTIHILDAEFNELQRIDVGSSFVAPPILDRADNIVIGSLNGWVYSFRSDGTERWRYQTSGQITEPAALGGDGTVYITTNDGYLYALGGSILELTGEQKTAPLNSEVPFNLTVSEITDLAGVSAEIAFDNSVVEVSSITTGSFFTNTTDPLLAGGGWVKQANVTYNNDLGIIKLAGSKIGTESFSGSNTLATIVFRTKAKGITLLTLNSYNLVDKNSNPITPLKKDSVLEVSAGNLINGILNAEGQPDYRDFTISLEDETGMVLREIKPLANGHFAFTEVPSGNYSISVAAPSYLRQRTDRFVLDALNSTKDVGAIPVGTGDLDNNNSVDLLDLVLFANAYGSVPGDLKWRNNADFNKDNRVDILDLTYLSRNLDKLGANPPIR